MKILLAIPSKNQIQYLEEMIASLEAQSVLPDKVLYLMDRPSGRDRITAMKRLSGHKFIEPKFITQEPEYIGRPMMYDGEDHFLTGYVRETAVDYMIENGYDAVVFLDGDCMPEKNFVRDHKRVLSKTEATTTVGKRKEKKFKWDDQRAVRETSSIILFKPIDAPVMIEGYFVDSGVVWTCNFGMNIAAVKKLREVNKTIYGRNEVFPSDFLGTWGGEDGFIGLECFYTGVEVIALKDDINGIRHIDHPRPVKKYDHVRFIDYLEERREELLFLLDLYGMNSRKIRYIPRPALIAAAGIKH